MVVGCLVERNAPRTMFSLTAPAMQRCRIIFANAVSCCNRFETLYNRQS